MPHTTITIQRGDSELEIDVSATISCCYGELDLDNFRATFNGAPFDLDDDECELAKTALEHQAQENSEHRV